MHNLDLYHNYMQEIAATVALEEWEDGWDDPYSRLERIADIVVRAGYLGPDYRDEG